MLKRHPLRTYLECLDPFATLGNWTVSNRRVLSLLFNIGGIITSGWSSGRPGSGSWPSVGLAIPHWSPSNAAVRIRQIPSYHDHTTFALFHTHEFRIFTWFVVTYQSKACFSVGPPTTRLTPVGRRSARSARLNWNLIYSMPMFNRRFLKANRWFQLILPTSIANVRRCGGNGNRTTALLLDA